MHEEIRVRDSNGGGHNDIVTLISSEYHPNLCADVVTYWCSVYAALCELSNKKRIVQIALLVQRLRSNT